MRGVISLLQGWTSPLLSPNCYMKNSKHFKEPVKMFLS